MVDYARDLAPWITLGRAVELIMACGPSEDDARTFLVEAIKDRLVKFRGPPRDCWLKDRAIDWDFSLGRDFLIAPVIVGVAGDQGGQVHPIWKPILLCRANVLALCEQLRALNPPVKPGDAPARRAKEEVHKLLKQMRDNGELVFGHGGLRLAAKQLHKHCHGYDLKSIENLIRPMFNQWKIKSIPSNPS